jgi:hypothetical protein
VKTRPISERRRDGVDYEGVGMSRVSPEFGRKTVMEEMLN